jgi:hypothetical protein
VLPPPLPTRRPRPLKWIILSVVVVSLIGLSIPLIRHFSKPRFPWQDLKLDTASLHSSLDFNPYSDYPPRHRWEIGVRFKEFALHPGGDSDAPYFTYSLDLDQRGWSQLPGIYELDNRSGSDFWYGDENLGPIYLDKVEFRRVKDNRFEMVLHLSFEFEEADYRPEKKQFTIPVDYEGLTFITPIWNEPDKVTFPPSWGIPSTKTHWSDEQIKTFVAKYVDLSQYGEPEIDQSGTDSVLKASPR